MKKFQLLFLLMLLPLVASAYDAKIDGIYYNFNTEDKTAGVTYRYYYSSDNRNAYSGDVVIPEKVTYNEVEYSVTSIEESAFYNCYGLTAVTIPNSVTSIGNYAFNRCSGLTSVTIPNSVTSIGSYAFYNCSGLTSITIPNSVTSIGSNAFSECSGLTTVHITDISAWCEISFGNYDSNPLQYAHHLYLGDNEIKDLIIPNSVTSIGDYVFCNCTGLTSVTIPNSVTSIGDGAFSGCTGLTSVTIPNSVTSIGSRAFYNCSDLTSVTIPNSVTSIGEYAFSNTNLKKTIWLTNTPPSGYTNAKGSINYVANNQYSSLSNVKVYPFLSSIFEVDGIKYVPVSPSERTCDAIDCCYDESVKNIKIAKQVVYKGVTLNVGCINAYTCYGNNFIEQAELFNDSNIGDYAFNGCTALERITLGDKVTAIGVCAFLDCSALQSVTIPNAVTTIGQYAFSGCSKMTNASIGNAVKTINSYAFAGCTLLPKIIIPQSVTTINNSVFNGCQSLKEVIIKDRESELQLGSKYYDYTYSPLFADCPLDSVYIGGNITYNTASDRGYSPFYRNTTLRTVVITDKETEISANEFYGCTNLQNFSVGDGVKSFGDWAFSGCSSLKKLSFGSQLETIGKEAFSDCTSVTEIVSKTATPPVCSSQALDDINKWNCTLNIPQGTLAAYQAADQWKEFFFVSEGGSVVPITDPEDDPEVAVTQAVIQLGATKTMAGYSFSEALDFSGVTNGKAWIAAGFVEGNKVMLMRVNIVPANTGIIVTSDTPGAKIIAPVTTKSAYYTNMLVPILEKQTIYPTQYIDGVEYTYMGVGTISGTTQTGFVKIGASQSYGPNKSLLRVPTEYLSTAARGLDELEVVFDETSAIRNMQGVTGQDAGTAIYNLQGQRMSKPTKGLYIKNGKKYVR